MTGVKDDAFYGWPYSYWGAHPDPSIEMEERPDLVKKDVVPDVSLGAHTASLGLAFDEQETLPSPFKGGVFIAQHGSWNRSSLAGYQVAFVPFKNGKPDGGMRPFLSGFIADEKYAKVYGRPVGVAFDNTGALLVNSYFFDQILWYDEKSKYETKRDIVNPTPASVATPAIWIQFAPREAVRSLLYEEPYKGHDAN